MKTKLKVYGITTFTKHRRGQWRYVAAVSSEKEFAQLLRVSLGHLKNYGSRTSNEAEVKQALANPHKLIAVEPRDYSATQAYGREESNGRGVIE